MDFPVSTLGTNHPMADQQTSTCLPLSAGKHQTAVLLVLTSNQRRGAEIEAVDLAEQLGLQDVRVTLVALRSSSHQGEPLEVPVLCTRSITPVSIWRLRRLARLADVVVAYGSKTLPACSIATLGLRTPWIYRSIGNPASWVRGPLHRIRTGLLVRRATGVVALWTDAANYFRSVYGAEQVDVIPNARSITTFAPPTRRRSPTVLPTVLIAGALSNEKRPLLGIQIALSMPHSEILVAGDGPLRPELERWSQQAGHRSVRFLGQVSDMPHLYSKADLLLLPSSTEGLPGVVIEALMSGVPVVASDVGGLRSINVDHLVLVDPDAPIQSWVRASSQALTNTCTTTDRMEDYDWNVVTETWITLLRRYTATRQRP